MTVKSNVTSHFKDISINPYIIVEAHVHDLPTAQGNIRNTLYFKRGKAHLKDMKINPKLHWDSSPWHYNGSRKASSKRSSFFFRSIYSWIIFDDSACLVFFWGMCSRNSLPMNASTWIRAIVISKDMSFWAASVDTKANPPKIHSCLSPAIVC